MDREMKKLLRDAAGSPNPQRKDQFIRKYRNRFVERRQIPTCNFICTQFAYIPWYVWVTSASVVLYAVHEMQLLSDGTLRVISALMPFFSLAAVLVTFRSGFYRLNELEAVTRVSSRGLFFARTCCIGCTHMITLAILIIILGFRSENGYLMTAALIIIPYLLTAAINTRIERTAIGRNHVKACLVVSAVVSIVMLQVTDSVRTRSLLRLQPMIWWIVMGLMLAMELFEIRETMKQEAFA